MEKFHFIQKKKTMFKFEKQTLILFEKLFTCKKIKKHSKYEFI